MVIIIHHLQVSQSERIPWLCEELGVEYELKTYKRSPMMAPPEYKALHPMGSAPVIEDGDLVLAESCACIEYLCHRYGDGKLFLSSADPAYVDFLYWWHWVDGTFQPTLVGNMMAAVAGLGEDNPIVAVGKDRFTKCLGALDKRLRHNTWLAGSEFTVADLMVVFSLTTIRYFNNYSLAGYDNILKFLQRIGERNAFRQAMQKCDPDLPLALEAEAPERKILV